MHFVLHARNIHWIVCDAVTSTAIRIQRKVFILLLFSLLSEQFYYTLRLLYNRIFFFALFPTVIVHVPFQSIFIAFPIPLSFPIRKRKIKIVFFFRSFVPFVHSQWIIVIAHNINRPITKASTFLPPLGRALTNSQRTILYNAIK